MDGQIEPLFAIWSSEALELLKENVGKGRTGPIYTLKALGNGIEPRTRGGYIIPIHRKSGSLHNRWLNRLNIG
jgi:hypothetical protein